MADACEMAEDSARDAHVEDPALAAELTTLLQRYNSVFPTDLPAGLPPSRNVQHPIPLQPGATPPHRRILS